MIRQTRCALVTGVQTWSLPIWNSAQSAATKAVQQERPFNPVRITMRRPGISCVDTRLRNRMLRMSKAGKTQKEIAAKFDLCVRTVSYHIGLAKRGVTLARKTSPKGVNREKHPPSNKSVNRLSGKSKICIATKERMAGCAAAQTLKRKVKGK